MNLSEILYINDLIFNQLVQHKSVHLEGVGSLECLLRSTSKNYTESVNEVPKYEINFTFEAVGDSVSKLISDKTNCAPKEAKEIYEEWITGVKSGNDTFARYVIKKVGLLDVQLGIKGEFKCDKELSALLEPLTIENIKKPIKENINSTSAQSNIKSSNIKKYNSLKKTIIFLSVFVLAITSYVVTTLLLTTDVNNSVNNFNHNSTDITTTLIDSTKMLVDTITVDNTQIDSTITDTKATTEIENTPNLKGGYYVVANTFIYKENAQKRLTQLKGTEKNVAILEVPNHLFTPYFVTIDCYDNFESARARVNSSNLEEVWVFKFD